MWRLFICLVAFALLLLIYAFSRCRYRRYTEITHTQKITVIVYTGEGQYNPAFQFDSILFENKFLHDSFASLHFISAFCTWINIFTMHSVFYICTFFGVKFKQEFLHFIFINSNSHYAFWCISVFSNARALLQLLIFPFPSINVLVTGHWFTISYRNPFRKINFEEKKTIWWIFTQT